MPHLDPAAELADKDLAFLGVVTDRDGSVGCGDRGTLTFQVDEAWKGATAGREVEVGFSTASTTECGAGGSFGVGSAWIVFADRDEGLGFCSSVVPLGGTYFYCGEETDPNRTPDEDNRCAGSGGFAAQISSAGLVEWVDDLADE